MSIGADSPWISVEEGYSFGESSLRNEIVVIWNRNFKKKYFLFIYFFIDIIYIYIVHNLTLARSNGSQWHENVARCTHTRSVHPQQQNSHLNPSAVRWQKKSAFWPWYPQVLQNIYRNISLIIKEKKSIFLINFWKNYSNVKNQKFLSWVKEFHNNRTIQNHFRKRGS